jgi:hydroxyethylthiazole kinase-like uncharacterized protein yjeF
MNKIILNKKSVNSFRISSSTNKTNKDERGKIFIIAGSHEMPGPAMLAGLAALRAGAGKVQIATAESVSTQLIPHFPEARIFAIKEKSRGVFHHSEVDSIAEKANLCSVILIGPGLFNSEENRLFLKDLLLQVTPGTPIILDATALDLVLSQEVRKIHSNNIIICPHPGEMNTLTGKSIESIQKDSTATAQEFSNTYNCITVLKDHHTAITSSTSGELFLHKKGSPGLATSGSGDVLSGIIAGCISKTSNLQQAAALAVYIHGKAGRLLEEKLGQGFLAREILKVVPLVMKELAIY